MKQKRFWISTNAPNGANCTSNESFHFESLVTKYMRNELNTYKFLWLKAFKSSDVISKYKSDTLATKFIDFSLVKVVFVWAECHLK